jgi:hypothetical protein
VSDFSAEAGSDYQALVTSAGGDPDALRERVLDRIRNAYPGWNAIPGDLAWHEADAIAEEAGYQEDVLQAMGNAIIEEWALRWLQIPRGEATRASAVTSWTRSSTAGARTISAPVQLSIEGVAFTSISDVAFPDGQATVTGVTIAAVYSGAAGSGLSGAVRIEDATQDLAVTLTDPATANGQDEESLDDYRDKAVRAWRTGGTLVRPEDVAARVLNNDNAGRVLVKNLYNPAVPGDPVAGEGFMAVFVVDDAGADLTGPEMDEIEADLQAHVLPGINTPVAGATRTPVAVAAKFSVVPGYVFSEVAVRVEAAIRAKVDPATWGNLPALRTVTWTETLIVRYLEVAAAIDLVPGVDQVDEVKLNGSAANVTISGPAALPTVAPGAVTLTELA